MDNMEGRLRRLGGLVLLSLIAIAPLAATDPEDELKSATVLTLIRHAEWQNGAPGPISIVVLGRPAMVETLRRSLEGRTANNRVIHIADSKAPADLRDCQVLYIASDNNKEVGQILAASHPSRPLTIGEAGRFLEYGGAVKLLIVDGHISFEVSREALERAGIAIDATVLRYGQVISSPSRQGRPPV